ncbi:hypothetical protein UACE39S_00896 [Ureibacillus acetophenoni]
MLGLNFILYLKLITWQGGELFAVGNETMIEAINLIQDHLFGKPLPGLYRHARIKL